ncbi:hypothetical protein GCM10009654_00190 [Streptomyces hebeiensis]|uniref:Lipoprotein n=1 Tax=Streptomyces hebeiensis TaxID=229486 RepID=A0ABN1UF64_9ACTN
MRSNIRTAATAVATAVLCAAALAGCSGDGGSSAAKKEGAADFAAASPSETMPHSPSPSVNVGKVSAVSGPLGKILVDGRGHTLYLFEADTKNKSNCSGQCAVDWPPLIVATKPVAGSGGVKAGWLSTITRSDGKKQVTYDGHPLYTFDLDKKPGEFKGQGLNQFGGKWYVLGVDGKKITTMPPGATTSPSHTGSPSPGETMSPSATGASPS